MALVLLSALAACSNKNGTPYPTPPPTGSSDAAVTGAAGAIGGITGIAGRTGGLTGAAGFDAGASSGTVTVAIQSPTMGAILSTNASADVAAKVTITGGTDVVDPATVRVALVAGAATVSAAPLIAPSGSSLYAGKLSLAGLATGDYTLVVSARSSTNALGSATATIKLDSGPVITVLSPAAGHHYKGSLVTQVIIDPGSYPPASPIAASLAGTPLTLQPAGPTNVYRAVFDLSMPTPLSGDQLFEVSAKDMQGTLTDVKLTFNVDITGPSITMTAPAPGAIVGGVITISAAVVDGAGVDDSSVQVLIGDATTTAFRLPLTLDTTTAGVYSTIFDTNNLTKCKLTTDPCIVRPTLSFRAADALGNQTTVSYERDRDRQHPTHRRSRSAQHAGVEARRGHALLVGLRPARPRHRRRRHAERPLRRTPGVRSPREDRGRRQPRRGAQADPDLDRRSRRDRRLHPRRDDRQRGRAAAGRRHRRRTAACDVPSTRASGNRRPSRSRVRQPRQVLKVRPQAGPARRRGGLHAGPVAADRGRACEGIDTDAPDPFCKSGPQPTDAISYAGGLPAIWSVEPIAPADPAYCFGAQFDTKANNVTAVVGSRPAGIAPTAGWKCIAVVTADMLGNASTSAPLRVYLDDYAYGGQDSQRRQDRSARRRSPRMPGRPRPARAPSDRTTGLVSQQACKTRNFKPPTAGEVEVCYDKNDCGVVSEFH